MAQVSIITPAYNASKFIAETISSVQNQTFQDWEIIIVDDISTDNTAEIVKSIALKDPRVKFYQLPQKGGPAKARNLALAKASGKFIAFLDSDDLWLPAKLEVQTQFLTQNNAAFCFSSFRRISEDGKEMGRLITVPSKLDYRQLLKHNVIGTLTVMIDRSKTGNFQMIDEGYDDFICWLEILKKTPLAHGLNQDLARYRIVSKSVSSKRMRSAKWVWNIYRNVEKLSLPDTLWVFANYAIRTSIKHGQF